MEMQGNMDFFMPNKREDSYSTSSWRKLVKSKVWKNPSLKLVWDKCAAKLHAFRFLHSKSYRRKHYTHLLSDEEKRYLLK